MAEEVKHVDYTGKEFKKHKNLDEFFNHLNDTHYKDLTDSFKDIDNFQKEENLNHYYNNVFTPGIDELYKKTTDALTKTFKDDNAKVHQKKEDLQKAIVEGIMAYFDKVHPGALKDFDKKATIEDQYEILTGLMDEFLGASGRQSYFRGLAENFAKNKKATIGHIKKHLKENQGEYLKNALNYVVNQKVASNLAGKHRVHIASHVKGLAEKAGYTIDDKVQYSGHDVDDLMRIRRGVEKGVWVDERGRAVESDAYGLSKKEDDKKKYDIGDQLNK